MCYVLDIDIGKLMLLGDRDMSLFKFAENNVPSSSENIVKTLKTKIYKIF
jgi:hypothetical protein